MPTHLSQLRRSAFVLWRPQHAAVAPRLRIGVFAPGNPPTLGQAHWCDLQRHPEHDDVWLIDAAHCGLCDGQVYHYWFEVTDSSPYRDGQRILCSDPLALSVDWRLLAPRLETPYGENDRDPAGVTRFVDGELLACDPDGNVMQAAPPLQAARSAPNNRLVIYELPTSWTRMNDAGDPELGTGSFRDVMALVDRQRSGENFADITMLDRGESHLSDLGVNALELLPIADSFVNREWGYATSNYLAPDYDLGFPIGNASPTALADLVELVTTCHRQGIRMFCDVVMAFATRGTFENINFADFHIDPAQEPNDVDAQQSGGQGRRDAFGGTLWRYSRAVSSYDPLDGERRMLVPARHQMLVYLTHWMETFAIDGLRLDSVNNIANWDFVRAFKDRARTLWRAGGGPDDRFLTVGEELSVPLALLEQNRLEGLWNERFKHLARAVILGESGSEPDFATAVRKLIDCRQLGFHDGTQAVNYLGSHDVEGFKNERLFNFLLNNGVPLTEERIKLAFVCLLTAVGIPMIFAGDEFADQHDLSVSHPPKQRDAVNFERREEPFRRRIFDYTARLVKFRISEPALAVNDTDFIHADFNDGKRVVCWRRGFAGADSQVVVVANFSPYRSDSLAGGTEYRVPNWPATPPGKRWREITQQRDVPAEWVAREPIFPWEAKVYALV